MHHRTQDKSSFSRKAGLFLLLCGLYYVFMGRSETGETSEGVREWAKEPKVLSRAVSEEELEKFPADAFSYIAMIDVSVCRSEDWL
jgi:hypothetical protein